jgi:hypothetical protein
MPIQTPKSAEARSSIARKTTKGGKTTGKARDSQLEDFIRRANDHKIGTEESGSGGEDWELMDAERAKKVAEDAEDDQEWVMVETFKRGS